MNPRIKQKWVPAMNELCNNYGPRGTAEIPFASSW